MTNKEQSAYQNLARKYRPALLRDLVGQETVASTIANSLKMGRVAHAYLFHGPRGCGKTSMARLLARALNCTGGGADKPVPEPCGKCVQCREIAASSDLDVLEIDAASNTEVAKVREVIIDTVSLSAVRDRYKVFILDEVHMLSGSSFNALLKTIEEPPPHVVFILATTERHKVPATIASRCQNFRFKPITQAQIEKHLAHVAHEEGIKIEPQALELIAASAGGAMRDALTLLDRAVSFSSGELTREETARMLGCIPDQLLKQAVAALLARDGAALHSAFESLNAEGHEPVAFLREIRNAVSALFFVKSGFGREPFKGASELVKDVSAFTLANLSRRIARLIDEVRFSDLPAVAAEVGLFTLLEAVPDVEKWLRRLESLENRISGGAELPPPMPAPAPVVPAQRPEPQLPPAKPARETAAHKHAAKAPESHPAPKKAEAPAAPAESDEPDAAVWQKVLGAFASSNPILHDILSKARAEFLPGGVWKLLFQDEFHRNSIERSLSGLEKALASVSSRKVKFQLAVAPRAEEPAHMEEISAEETLPEVSAEEPLSEGSWQELPDDKSLENNPAVKKVLKIIPGRIMKPRKH
ncbi:MAG: DNA polymerase III subunit gamma/tau [Elusimicrobia bacterium]|nr:DNA polymerase III subunit gamma/tau [Elusimicrobiota bacterium]